MEVILILAQCPCALLRKTKIVDFKIKKHIGKGMIAIPLIIAYCHVEWI
jgi:hypothetical protein